MLNAQDILTNFEKIPATFWGVIIGSFFSLAGITLTNRAADNRQRKDLKMRTKRDIYLEAAEAISASMNAIGRFPNFNLSDDRITNDHTEKMPSIAKTHIIGEMETIGAISNFSTELESTYMELYAKRHQIALNKNELDIIDGAIAESSKNQDRFVELMRQYNIDGIHDPERWESIETQFNHEHKNTLELIQKRSIIAQKFHQNNMLFARECVSESLRLEELLVPVLSSIRKELESGFDEDLYYEILNRKSKNFNAAIEQFEKSTASLINQQPDSSNEPVPSQL